MKNGDINDIRKKIKILQKQAHHRYMVATYIRYSLIILGIISGFVIAALSIYYFIKSQIIIGVSLLIISLAITAILIFLGNIIFYKVRKINMAIASDMILEIKRLKELEKIYNNRY